MPLIRFLHLTIFNYTALLPLLGLWAVQPNAPWPLITLHQLIALAYHSYAYLLNDVIDLPIDRPPPSRAAYPLVAGTISPQTTLWIAGLSGLLAIGLTAVFLPFSALPFLLLSLGGISFYNRFGKAGLVPPPLTDFIQGCSWGCLVLFGATSAGELNGLVWQTAVFIILYILLVNGVNGSLRDLPNDLQAGATTTPIWFNVRPTNPHNPENPKPESQANLRSILTLAIPQAFRRYALLIHLLLLLLLWLPLWLGWWVQNRPFLLPLLLLLGLAAHALLWRIVHNPHKIESTKPLLMLHNIIMLLLLLLQHLFILPTTARLTLIAVFILPLLTSDWLYDRLTLR